MPNPFQNFDWSLRSFAKIGGGLLIGIVALALAAMIITFLLRTVSAPFFGSSNAFRLEKSVFSRADSLEFVGRGGGVSIGMPPIEEPVIATDAEDFEVHEYNASFEKHDKTETCETIAALKGTKSVVFENANESKRSCNYRFRVANKRADEILELLKSLDPDTLSSNVYTIQKRVEGIIDQLEVQKKKLAQVEATLADAQNSYTELTALATRKNDIESLIKLIDLKLDTIERLARERIEINNSIVRIERERADQLERLNFTVFSVNVYERPLIDWSEIKDDWQDAIRSFVDDVNEFTQLVSVRLISFVLQAAVALVYLVFVFVFLRVVWILGRKILWKK